MRGKESQSPNARAGLYEEEQVQSASSNERLSCRLTIGNENCACDGDDGMGTMCMYLPAKRRQSFPLFLSAIFEGVRSPFLSHPDLSCKVLADVSNQGLEREICNHTLVLSLADNALPPVGGKRVHNPLLAGERYAAPCWRRRAAPCTSRGSCFIRI